MDELRLDLANVRIRTPGLDETAALNYLYASEDVPSLAHDILRDGYLDNEIPIVARENGEYVVLEGNRRIAALKGLNDPSAVPSREQQLQRLISRYEDSPFPSEIRVMVAPDRATAQPLLARLHTSNPKKSWPREQQAVFYHSQLSQATTPDDLRRLYPSEARNITRFLRMAEMWDLVRTMKFQDKQLKEYIAADQLKMTAFEYAYAKPMIQVLAGLNFDKNGLLTRKLAKAEERVLTRILQDIKSGLLNTRAPQLKANTDEHAAYIAELALVLEGKTRADFTFDAGGSGQDSNDDRGSEEDERPDETTSDGTSSGDEYGGRGGDSSGPGTERPTDSGGNGNSDSSGRNPNRGSTRARLNMTGVDYANTSPGLRRRFEELSRLNVREFPNATFDLLRTVLECSIKQYFRDIGEPLAVGSTLGPSVIELAKHFQSDKKLTLIINAINRRGRLKSEEFQLTYEALNASNHEPDAFADSEYVHASWDRLVPLITRLLQGKQMN